MILPFKQVFPWHTKDKPAPTYFREKILMCAPDRLIENGIMDVLVFGRSEMYGGSPKKHTIRAGSRWKVGDKMHMAYGVRTKNYQQFNKGIPELERVKSVQRIEIIHKSGMCRILIDGHIYGIVPTSHNVSVVKSFLKAGQSLAVNDGFAHEHEFTRWFNKDFEGQIIHWTDLRY
jgi:hypothetical protein